MQKNLTKAESCERRSKSQESRKSFTIRNSFNLKGLQRYINNQKGKNAEKSFFLRKNNKNKTIKKYMSIEKNDSNSDSLELIYKNENKVYELSFLKNIQNLQNLQKEIQACENQKDICKLFQEMSNSSIQQEFNKKIDYNQFNFSIQNYSFILKERDRYTTLCQQFYKIYMQKYQNKKTEFLNLEPLKTFFTQYVKLLKKECLQKGQIIEIILSFTFQIYENLVRKKTQQMLRQGKIQSDKFIDNLKYYKQQNQQLKDSEKKLREQNFQSQIILKVAKERNQKLKDRLFELQSSEINLKVRCKMLYKFWSRFEKIKQKFNIFQQLVNEKSCSNEFKSIFEDTQNIFNNIDTDYLQFAKWAKSTNKQETLQIPDEQQYLCDVEYFKDLFKHKNKQTQTIIKQYFEKDVQTFQKQQDVQTQTQKPKKIKKKDIYIQVETVYDDIQKENTSLKKQVSIIKSKYKILLNKVYKTSNNILVSNQQQIIEKENLSYKLKEFWQIGPIKFKKLQQKFADYYIPFPNQPKYYSLSKIINKYQNVKFQDKTSSNTIKTLCIDLLRKYVNRNNTNQILIEFFDHIYSKNSTRKQAERQCQILLKEIQEKNKKELFNKIQISYTQFLLDTNPLNFSGLYIKIMVKAIESLDQTQFKKVSIIISNKKQIKTHCKRHLCKKIILQFIKSFVVIYQSITN